MAHTYFGYGSNLHQEDLQRWAAGRGREWTGRFLGRAELPDHQLNFHYYSSSRSGGALNIAHRLGSLLVGGLFEVSDDDLELLDRKEGAPRCYRRKTIRVWWEGQWTEAITYEVTPEYEREFCPPTPEYLQIVQQAYEQLGIPAEALHLAAQAMHQPCCGLFVYGTLLREEPLHACLSPWKASCCLPAEVQGELYDLGWYPGLKASNRSERVRGEFLSFPDIDQVLARLDEVEGHGHLYERRVVAVTLGDGSQRQGWTYFYLGTVHRRIESGDWRRHRPQEAADFPQ